MDVHEAANQASGLASRLKAIQARDPEQEVQGIAVPVVSAVLEAGRAFLPSDHPVISQIRELF
jgi:hypothetical protein